MSRKMMVLSVIALAAGAANAQEIVSQGVTETPAHPHYPPALQPADDGPVFAIEPADIAAQPRVPSSVTLSQLYSPLVTYGSWIEDPMYGTVFAPADPLYRPYVNGYWERTASGPAWVSSDAFGTLCDHYGSWAYDGRWVWVPGNTYQAAAVEWRTGPNGAIGWAPRPPSGYGAVPSAAWTFVDGAYLYQPNVGSYAYSPDGVVSVLPRARRVRAPSLP